MSLRTSLGRVRGLGTAKEGTGHWWTQRLTSLALIPLSIWFVASVAAHAGADYEAMRAWVGSPLTASLLLLLVVTTFYHSYLGLQVVIEDYVHHEGLKFASLIVVQGASFLLGTIAVVSVFMILFGG